jgi:phosphoserine phosphatase
MTDPAPVTGLCLDVDGTLYRDGSVFIETIARLPHAAVDWSAADRAALRRTVGVVGDYHGGRWTARRWRLTLGLVGLVGRVGGPDTAVAALERLRELQARVDDPRSGPARDRSTADYERMRASVLETYGAAVAGHRRATLVEAVAGVLADGDPVDGPTATTLRELAGPRLEVALVTDMPAHVAEPFAESVLGVPTVAVAATRFGTDGDGRLTGGIEPVRKGRAVAALRERRGWSRVVAAGDSVPDLAMREHAGQFIAVGGQGRIREALPEHAIAGETSERRLHGASVVYVPREQPLGTVLRSVLAG